MAFLEHFKQDRENLFLGKLKNIMMGNYFQIKEIETKKNVANKKAYDVMEMRRNIGEEELDEEIQVESKLCCLTAQGRSTRTMRRRATLRTTRTSSLPSKSS